MTTSRRSNSATENRRRLRVEIRGAVQGVGFRPFVYRLAHTLELSGWVINDSRGVILEVEGAESRLQQFLGRVQAEAPPRALLLSVEHRYLEPTGCTEFVIRPSQEQGSRSVVMLPDIATCDDCRADVEAPENRRYRYPFTNCTNCGPRFTIIRDLPYDRPLTTMRDFAMCAACAHEYEQPLDRRFHAQPNACPVCGPQLELRSPAGELLAEGDAALRATAEALAGGAIAAVKGLGGFHLLVDARSEAAVSRLRQRKGRYEKPLALMARDLGQVGEICHVSDAEAAWLGSPEAPIVLLDRHPAVPSIADSVAPGNPRLGVMLPYTPLHHLLLRTVDFPLVATSGNLSDEPICIDNREALERLGEIADCFLMHDRPIQRHVDDSVVHRIAGDLQPIRRARGLAPMPIVRRQSAPPILAVGGHLKNVVALGIGDRVFLSQHIGDMETPQAHAAFEAVIADFLTMYDVTPVAIAHDLHPDYPATRWAQRAVAGELDTEGPERLDGLAGLPTIAVQHHHAHLAACLAEHGIEGAALGVTWDGTGYGTDGSVWGGEFLRGDASGFERVARLRPFGLPGGDAAVKQPRRVALALLWELEGDAALDRDELAPVRDFDDTQRRLLADMLRKGINAPRTTSAGRLFDAIASLIDLRQEVAFEGQAAMALEFIADRDHRDAYPLEVRAAADEPTLLELDWQPLVAAVIEDSRRRVSTDIIAARFHNALVEAVVATARTIGEPLVALTGGCFQNRLLTERLVEALPQSGLDPLIHRQVPANDGGISLGQVAIAAARLRAATG